MEEQAIGALGKAIFQNDASQLTLEHLQAMALETFATYWLGNRIPKAYAAEARKIKLQSTAVDLMQHSAYQEIATLFQAQHIVFCPLKGADLAWRVYPLSGVRAKDDLDILVHRADLNKAVELLQNSGWKTPYQYRSCRHLPQMQKGKAVLEIHFHLPRWEHIEEKNLWKTFRKINEFQYQLPLELNLAMLFKHSLHHHWNNGKRLLLDSAFLVKAEGAPDWRKMKTLENELQIHSPALLFRAFPDFFPASALPPEEFPEELCIALRRTILTPVVVHTDERAWVDEHRYSWKWWTERIHTFPAAVRIYTRNPSGHYGRLLLGYGQVILAKLRQWRQLKHSGVSSAIFQRLQDEKKIETYLNNK